MQTHIHLAFADGQYRFALGLVQLHELQTKCGVGIGALVARVIQGRHESDISVGHPAYAAYHAEDLVEVVRQGLIGGGEGMVDGQDVKVGAMRANQLVENYLLPLPLMEQWNIAAAILHAKVNGWVDPDAQKKSVAGEETEPTTAGGSTTPAP